MTYKLKHILLLLWIGSILLILLLVAGLFPLALTRNQHLDAQAKLEAGFVSLGGEIGALRKNLLAHAHNLTMRETLLSILEFLNAHPDLYRSPQTPLDEQKRLLANELLQMIPASEIELLAIYDLNLRLVSFYCGHSGGVGYVSYSDHSFQALHFTPGLDPQGVILPPILEAHPPMLPRQPEFSLAAEEEGLMLILDVPFERKLRNGRIKSYGVLRLGHRLDKRFAKDFMAHSDLQLQFGRVDGLQFGEYIKYNQDDRNLPQLTPTGLASTPSGWLHATSERFIARALMSLPGGDAWFTLAMPRLSLQMNINALKEVYLWIGLIIIPALLPLFLFGLHRLLFQPLTRFVDAMINVAQGRAPPSLTLPGDELNVLGSTLMTMNAGLQQRDELLHKLTQVVEHTPTAVMITNTAGEIEYINRRFTQLTGYTPKEIRGRRPNFLKSGFMSSSVYERLWQTLLDGEVWRGEMYNRKKDGSYFWEAMQVVPFRNLQGQMTHFLALKEDISLRKEYEKQLNRQNSYDPLTNLPNRGLANDRLSQALAMAHRTGKQVALLFIDLDNFKKINDTLGHQAGDNLLVEIAARLRAHLWEEDTLARQGGDEFLVILPNLNSATTAEVVAQKLLASFAKPVQMEDREIFVTASMGIVVAPADGDESTILMRNADSAMYRAKEAGRNTYRFFAPAMNVQAIKRLEMESELQRALEREELEVYYQAQVDAYTGQVLGAEALLRWHNAKLGAVPPSQFIPLAENSGMIELFGSWVLNHACLEAMRWYSEYNLPLRMAVNVSVNQFRAPNFFNIVAQALTESGLPPHLLELELTESILIENDTDTAALLHNLKALGLTLALDDFGTGYSSLLYLKRFPFDLLKIDRSFIQDINHDSDAAALTVAIINMAHSLSLKVIAEGVENPAQQAFLQLHHCDILQGYYFSRPLSAEDFAKYIHLPVSSESLTES